MAFYCENLAENENWLFLEQNDEFGLSYLINEVGEDFDWEKAKAILGKELEIGTELNIEEKELLEDMTYIEQSEW